MIHKATQLQKERVSAGFTTYAVIFFPDFCCGLEADLYLKLWSCLFSVLQFPSATAVLSQVPWEHPLSKNSCRERYWFLIKLYRFQWLANLERKERKTERRTKRKEENTEGEENAGGRKDGRRRRAGTPPSSFQVWTAHVSLIQTYGWCRV